MKKQRGAKAVPEDTDLTKDQKMARYVAFEEAKCYLRDSWSDEPEQRQWVSGYLDKEAQKWLAYAEATFEPPAYFTDSCVKHTPGTRNLPIIWSFVKETGDHAAACILGFVLGCYLRGELNGKSFSIQELVDGMLGMFKSASTKSAVYRLEDTGYLARIERDPFQIRDMLVRNVSMPEEPHCPWCKLPVRRTQKHHWPLTELEGGTETIAICHPCHIDYHSIARRKTYAPSPKAFQLFTASGITLEMIQ